MDTRLKGSSDAIELLIKEVGSQTRVITIGGLTSSSSKAHVLAKIQAATGMRIAIVAQTNEDLAVWESDLNFWTSSESGEDGASQAEILTLPSFDTGVYSGISPHAETQERRAMTLWQLTRERPGFVVVSARSLIKRTVAPEEMTK